MLAKGCESTVTNKDVNVKSERRDRQNLIENPNRVLSFGCETRALIFFVNFLTILLFIQHFPV